MGWDFGLTPRDGIPRSLWDQRGMGHNFSRMDRYMLCFGVACSSNWRLGCLALCIAVIALTGCANTEYGGLNYATVIAPNGEEWKVISGKDQTNTHLVIHRGDVVVDYSSEKEDASAALALAMKAQTDMFQGLVAQLLQLLAAAKAGAA